MTNAQKTITELLETYGDTLYQYALLKTANTDVAADIVQDTFEAAIRGLTTFKGKSNIKTWLFGILRNKINDYYRLKYREQPYSENDDSDIEDAVFNEGGYWKNQTTAPMAIDESTSLANDETFLNVLALCLQKLPVLWQAVLEGKYLKPRETQVLCQELNISTTNLWQINHRAKLSMQQCLQQGWFNHSENEI